MFSPCSILSGVARTCALARRAPGRVRTRCRARSQDTPPTCSAYFSRGEVRRGCILRCHSRCAYEQDHSCTLYDTASVECGSHTASWYKKRRIDYLWAGRCSWNTQPRCIKRPRVHFITHQKSDISRRIAMTVHNVEASFCFWSKYAGSSQLEYSMHACSVLWM